MLQHLIDRPALLAEAREAAKQDDPSTFDGYVWEALRFVPILPYLFRQCASPYTLGKKSPRETTIPAGAYVLPVVLSAMFDPHVFERPDEFDITRKGIPHMSFGGGSHICIGAPLARMEAIAFFSVFFQRFPTLKLVDEKPRWRALPFFRGLERLMVEV